MSRLGWLVTLALRTVSICCRYNYLLAEKMHKLKVENYYYYFFLRIMFYLGTLVRTIAWETDSQIAGSEGLF